MKLVLHGIGTWEHPNLRTWAPIDPETIAEELTLTIGPKDKKGSDDFFVRLATPGGLNNLNDSNGLISVGPLIVIRKYDFQLIFELLQTTVNGCEGASWLDCVENLRRHFRWEYEKS